MVEKTSNKKTYIERLNKTYLLIGLSLFITLEIVLYFLIHFSNSSSISTYCFLSIVLCFIFVLLFVNKKRPSIFIITASLFTLISDLLLVLLDSNYELAMVFFSIAQLSYFSYLFFFQDKPKRRIHIIVRVSLIVLSETLVIIFIPNLDFLIIISIFYAANLICNFIFSVINIKKDLLLSLGFLLFICCDICVGTKAASPYLDLSSINFFNIILTSSYNLAWIFYLPSQVIIALSIILKEGETRHEELQKRISY